MKTAVLFYTGYCDDWCIRKVSDWARTIPDCATISFCGPAASDAASLVRDAGTAKTSVIDTASLLAALAETAEAAGADNVVFAFGDSPFYDAELTAKLYTQHCTYAAEYSFADGYPQGLVPEILCAGTVKILQSLAAGTNSPAITAAASAPVTRESLFNLLKTDINSFEIETLLSPKDYRSWRLDFTVSTQEGRCICNRLRQLTESAGKSTPAALELCETAVSDVEVLHPVPAFYNVQIAGGCGGHSCLYCPYESKDCTMSLENFTVAVEKMAAVSEKATVSLSLWGEPFTHPQLPDFVAAVLSHDGFDVLIETSLAGYNQDTVTAISAIPGAATRVTWICSLDAATEETWNVVHPHAAYTLAEAEARAAFINSLFPGHTYTQFIRMNENEQELEAFYRSHENRLIQKYDSFCGRLPDRKPADLSPVLRFPCWHLRRDIAILADGSVPLCRERREHDIVGNIFTDDLQTIWKKTESVLKDHMAGTFCDACGNCDEYYTFNF